MWRSLSFLLIMSGLRRDKLQNANSGQSFEISSIYDFPIPEDPPVMTTAEKSLRAVPGEGIRFEKLNFPQQGQTLSAQVQPKSKPQP
jgi:hypothetical protein